MQEPQIVLKIEIPNYIRQVKLSDKARPLYYTWDGKTIRAKSKRVPLAFLKEEYKHHPLVRDHNQIRPEFLLSKYCLAVIKKSYIDEYTTLEELRNYKGNIKHLILYEKKGILGFEPIIANPNQVGQPNFLQIKGQDIYASLDPFIRNKIMDALHLQFSSAIRAERILPIPIESYPVYLVCELYDTVINAFDNSTTTFGIRWDIGNRLYPYIKAFPDTLVANGIITDDCRLHITGEQAWFCPIDNEADRKIVFYLFKDQREFVKTNPYYNGVYKAKEEAEKLNAPKRKFTRRTKKFNNEHKNPHQLPLFKFNKSN